MHRMTVLLLAIVCAAPAVRAGVFIVDASGAGDFLTLGEAVDVAQDGDTIRVRAGSYTEPHTLIIDGRSLTIAGEDPLSSGLPVVSIQPGLLIKNIAAGKHMTLQNLTLLGAPATPLTGYAALTLRSSVGHVRVQGCRCLGGMGSTNSTPDGLPGIDSAGCQSVALVGCTVVGGEGQFGPGPGDTCGQGAPGVLKLDGLLLIYDSTLDGGRGGSDLPGGCGSAGSGGAGLFQTGGTLFAVGTRAHGGDGGTGFYGGDGGTGMFLGGTNPVLLMGGTYANGGSKGYGDLSDGDEGVAYLNPAGTSTDYGGTRRGFELSSPVNGGGAGWFQLDAPTDESALIFLSPFLHQIPYPSHQGVLMLGPTLLLGPFNVGPPGNLLMGFTVPALGGGLTAFDLYMQPAYVGPSGTFLGPSRVMTIIDL